MLRTLLAVALLANAGASLAADVVRKPSHFSVEQTIDRLRDVVEREGFTVFARIDHAKGAASIGESLPPAQVLVFGNPKVGTGLMSSNVAAALHLPIRVAAWEDSGGTVWVTYDDPRSLAERHRITDRDALVARMTQALRDLTDHATTAQ